MHFLFLSFFSFLRVILFYLIGKADLQREGQTKRKIFVHRFTPQVATMSRPDLILSQEPEGSKLFVKTRQNKTKQNKESGG